jgi:hypothetical protein
MPSASLRGPTRRRLPGLALGVVLAVLAASCSGHDGLPQKTRASASGSAAPVVTPANPYVALDYANPAQRETFQAFLTCAASHGLEYEGPFTDSSGQSVFFRLAAGVTASHTEQDDVNADCPQMTVGLFGTPIGSVHIHPFERAAREFVQCVRSHGYREFPRLAFAGGSPVDAFWKQPFNWSSEPFTNAVRPCVDPLRNYLFSG